MKNYYLTSLLIGILACLGCFPLQAVADPLVPDGVYYISCTKQDGFLGLGSYHDVDPYIYYVTNETERTDDAYWIVTNTRSGYTIRNEATGDLLVYTTGRVDKYYKYMTLASESLGDHSEYWNIILGDDGAFSIQSAIATGYYWNLRSGTNMVGTYNGSNGTAANERFLFHTKDGSPDPGPQPEPLEGEYAPIVFPNALHVCLKSGHIEAYPLQIITNTSEQGNKFVIETNIGRTFTYNLSDINSVSEEKPDFPTFNSFKFSKKTNDQVFSPVTGEIGDDSVIATIGAIGKRLTPTIELSDENATVYVNGKPQGEIGDRLRFDKDIYYLIAPEGCTILMADAYGNYTTKPYGRVMRVHVEWLTDRAEVPTIYINTSDGQAVTSKSYFKDATIRIDGHGIFPSMDETEVQIKGRGNSSWSWPKKPYRLKFAEKKKPLGLTNGKSWVLLSNYQTGSLMSNAIGMKAANLMGASGANHIVPVDLYLNGEYRGSYNFTEKVGFANNSIDIDDETYAAMLELDSYYDEPDGQKFHSSPYNLPVNVKEPDFSEGLTQLTLGTIQKDFNNFMMTLYRGQDISKHVDIEQLVRFLMVNELTLNYEFYHPKSTFCYRENFESDDSKYIFGPAWDLDWCFGYEKHHNYFQNESTANYWKDMTSMEVTAFVRDIRFKYEPLNAVYRRLWEEFMQNDLQELVEYCQDYYDFARNSFDQNKQKWGDGTNYAQQAKTAANWLSTRTQKIYDDIVAGVRPYIPEPVEPVEFANNKLYTVTCLRGDLILSYDQTGLEAGQSAWWSVTSDEKKFAFINIEGNTYLYSPLLKKFLQTGTSSNGLWVDELGSPIIVDMSNPSGEYPYMISTISEYGSTLWFNNNTSTIVINGYSSPDAGNRWKITEAGSFDPTEALELAAGSMFAVTNRYIWEGEVIGTETHQMPRGSEPPTPSSEWKNAFISLTEPADMPYIITEDATIDYEVQWYGPFNFSTSFDDAYWYNMTIRSDYFVGRQESEPYYPSVVDEETLLYDGNYFWAFGGNPYHVKVYNYMTGFEQTLSYFGDYAFMRPEDFAWDLLPNRDGFVLRKPGTENCCINQFGGTNGPLKFWNDARSLTDNGSTFRIFEANPSGISSPLAQGIGTGGEVYNLAGQRVGKHYKGIVIKNGRKVLIK